MKNKLLVFSVLIFLIPLMLIFSASLCAAAYSVTTVFDSSSGNTEYRMYSGSQHFMTVILTSQNAISIRPRPGVDINGWGSSLYLQPFLAGATLNYTNIRSITASASGIRVIADGSVSKGADQTYGSWSLDISFNYDPASKEINGAGVYSINLLAGISSTTGDLSIYKLASNYLNNVPLLSGGTGDTGDMRNATVSGSNGYSGFTWNPVTQPTSFPAIYTQNLSIDVSGNYYNVDAVSQGYSPIAAAYKPNMKVVLNSRESGIRMMFGAIYNTALSQDFWEDNIGITPLIQQPTTKTNYIFDVTFYSKAPPGDGVPAMDQIDYWIWSSHFKPENGWTAFGWQWVPGDWWYYYSNGWVWRNTNSDFAWINGYQNLPLEINKWYYVQSSWMYIRSDGWAYKIRPMGNKEAVSQTTLNSKALAAPLKRT